MVVEHFEKSLKMSWLCVVACMIPAETKVSLCEKIRTKCRNFLLRLQVYPKSTGWNFKQYGNFQPLNLLHHATYCQLNVMLEEWKRECLVWICLDLWVPGVRQSNILTIAWFWSDSSCLINRLRFLAHFDALSPTHATQVSALLLASRSAFWLTATALRWKIPVFLYGKRIFESLTVGISSKWRDHHLALVLGFPSL